jgi:hypothetical protein
MQIPDSGSLCVENEKQLDMGLGRQLSSGGEQLSSGEERLSRKEEKQKQPSSVE